MALSDIVNVSISLSADKVTRAGFGVPMILAIDAGSGFTEKIRYYTDLAGVLVDFAVTTATYQMASRMFSQDPRPPRLAVGRLVHKPTLAIDFTPTAANSTLYQMVVNGNTVGITSDSSATVAEIVTALASAVTALAISGLTVTDGTTKLTLSSTAAGGFFSASVLNTALLKVANVTPDVSAGNLASDLAAIAAEDASGWYAMLHPLPSKAVLTILDTYAEANEKLLIAATQDSDVINLSDTTDNNSGTPLTIAGLLKSTTALRTALIYHPSNGAFADAALAGANLPRDPGSETWAFKSLIGVTASALTATQRTNAVAKFVTPYETVASVNVTEVGKVSGNEYIDVIRFRDWLRANMAADIFAAKTRMPKIPYTDAGIALIQGIVLARLKAGVAAGGLASSPAPRVTVPLAADVSSADKASRTLNNVKFDATLAGAIQITNITGVITA